MTTGIHQWKAKRNEAVGDSKTCAQTQTDDSNSITDETTQTEQLHSDEQALTNNNIDTNKGAIDPDKK